MKTENKHVLIILSVFALLTLVIIGMNYLVNNDHEEITKKEVSFCDSKLADDAGFIKVTDSLGVESCVKASDCKPAFDNNGYVIPFVITCK